jgi:uncharacterized membrane protein YhiD involved in acid resistance
MTGLKATAAVCSAAVLGQVTQLDVSLPAVVGAGCMLVVGFIAWLVKRDLDRQEKADELARAATAKAIDELQSTVKQNHAECRTRFHDLADDLNTLTTKVAVLEGRPPEKKNVR